MNPVLRGYRESRQGDKGIGIKLNFLKTYKQFCRIKRSWKTMNENNKKLEKYKNRTANAATKDYLMIDQSVKYVLDYSLNSHLPFFNGNSLFDKHSKTRWN